MLRTLKMMLAEKLYGTSLFEMAYNIKQIRSWITSGNLSQIVQNWCLVRYCSLYDKKSIYKNGWSKELYAKMRDLQKMYFKGDKHYVIEQCLIKEAEINKPRAVEDHLLDKWLDEHLPTDEKLTRVINDFIKELPILINYLSVNMSSEKSTKDSITELKNYCYNKI